METKPESLTLQLAGDSATAATASVEKREITGLAVPYGPVGYSSIGPITFAQGNIELPEKVGRVKFLKQHDPERSLGFAKELTDMSTGLAAAFHVAEGDDGDLALAEAADGRRDGLSVGVRLSQETIDEIWTKYMEGDNSPTAAKGQLIEVSQVSIPAFADARTEGSLAAADNSVVITMSYTNPVAQAATIKENKMVPEAPAAVETATAANSPLPEVSPAAYAGGAVTQVAEAPVYTFDGRGPSFVRDAWNARMSGDYDAHKRLNRFNEMLASNPTQVGIVTAAVDTTVTQPKYIQQGYAPNLMVEAIDKGRPLTSRIGTVNLTDATPFRIPVDGDFSGVDDHTEGTAHATEGTLTLGDVVITPGAVSGAYRLSRELVDSSNPALDQVALRAMLRDYRGVTETKVAAALLAADGTATLNINTVLEVRAEMNNFYDVMDEPASFFALAPSYYTTLLADVDGSGRPHLASLNPQNAVGQVSPGYTGAYIDGIELVKSNKIATNDGFLVNADDVLIGESAVHTFRFDEVEGPGVVKLALFAYFVAKVLRATSVVQLTSAAA